MEAAGSFNRKDRGMQATGQDDASEDTPPTHAPTSASGTYPTLSWKSSHSVGVAEVSEILVTS